MGLDMYLNKYPRYKDATANDVEVIDSYFDWKERGGCGYTLKEWCGVDENEISTDLIDFYKQKRELKHHDWDTDCVLDCYTCIKEVAYWRKANQINNYFVNYVQGGNDDCGNYDVSKKQLEDLLYKCKEVMRIAIMENSQVVNGYAFEDGKCIPCYEDGEVIVNADEVAAILPTRVGFFFGSTDYDSYYIDDIKRTIEQLEKILAETDFETEAIYYNSSW